MTQWKPKVFLLNLFKIDWVMLGAALLLAGGGLSTMYSFSGGDSFFGKQIAWLFIAVLVFFTFSLIDWRFFKKSETIFSLFLLTFLGLAFLLIIGQSIRGAGRWLDLGLFSIQISDPAKIVLIAILAKYFSRRHVEIAHFKHIIVSALYALIFFILIFLQPDLSSSIIIFLIWFGMVMVSGISKKHILSVLALFLLSLVFLWSFILLDYQKQRIVTFVNPLTDIRGTGYNAIQSVIAVGSGRIFGKGIGFGTQSRLRFLPEYQTDFIFAAFAEEWGLIGVLILFSLFGILIWRVVSNTLRGLTNLEILFGAGVAIFIISQFTINVGMNIGLLPVTGTPLPFLSYGGSHLITEFAALGILAGMRKYNRTFHKEETGEKVLV